MKFGLRNSLTFLLATLTTFVCGQDDELEIGGTIRADMSYFESQSTAVRQPPFVWSFNAQPRIRYGQWDIQTLLNLGSYQDRFGQPFNKLGTTVRRNWLTIHAGHRSMNFSPITLNGHLFFGAGVELRPAKFRFKAMYGNFQRAIQPDSTDVSIRPSFRRPGYGVSIGVGRPSNYVDVHMFRAQDDTTSLNYAPTYAGVAPKQNFVTGITIEQRFVHRFYLTVNGAASAYTHDMYTNTVDIEHFRGDDLAYALFKPRYSSQYLGAITGKFEYRQKSTAIGVDYKFIEPDFRTLGTYFFNSDLEHFGAHARWAMLDRKLNANVEIGQDRNNIKGNKTTDNTRQRVGGSLRYQPEFGRVVNVNYAGYRTNQERTDSAGNVTTLLDQFTHSLNGLSSIKFGEHTLSANANFLTRMNALTQSADFQSYGGRVAFSLPISESFSAQPEVKVNQYIFSGNNNSTRLGGGATVTKSLPEKGISATGGLLYTLGRLNGVNTSNTLRSHVNVSYMVSKGQRLSLRAYHSFTDRVSSSLNEFRVDVGWVWNL